MPITVGSLQVFDYATDGGVGLVNSTVDVGSAGTVRVLYVGGCGQTGYPYATVLDPGGADEIVGTLHAQDHSTVRGSGVLSVLIPPWLSGSYTLRTTFGTDYATDLRVWARVLNGTAYTPVSSYAMADPTYPFTPVLPLGTLSAGDLVIANANTAASTDAGFGDWSASTETLTETSSNSYSGNFWYSDGILNGVAGGSFTVSVTGDQVGSAAAIAYTARGAITMSATANLTEDDDATVTVQTIVATYLGSTEGNTWPALTVSGSIDIGAADPSRQIVGVFRSDETGVHPTGGTFAGQAATVDVEQFGSGGGWNSSILHAAVPSGSGTQSLVIDVTPFSGSFVVDWYSVTGAAPDLIDVASTNDVGPATADVTGVADGLVIAGQNGLAASPSLVGFDFQHQDSNGSTNCVSGYDAVAAAGTVAVADTAGGAGFSLVAISFAQAITSSAAAEILAPMRAEASLTEDDDATVVTSEVVVTYLGTIEDGNWSTTTISGSVDIGAADATKQIVGVLFMADAGCHATSATFAGVSASIDIEQYGTGGSHLSSILHAAVGTASGSQAMSITVTPYAGWHVVDWYSVTGADPALVDIVGDNGSGPLSLSIDGAAGGFVIAGFNGIALSYSFVDFDFENSESQAGQRTTSGYDATASGANSVVVDTPTSNVFSLAAISFVPIMTVATAEIVEGDPPPEPEPGPGGGATPYWGPPQKEKKRPSRASGGGAAGGGSIPKKQLKRAVRELLELEAGKAPGERTSADLAETVVEKLAPKGLAAPYRKPVVDFAREQLEKRLADYFASETKYDNEKLRLALLFILGETLERLRLAEEEEDDEEAVALLLMSVS